MGRLFRQLRQGSRRCQGTTAHAGRWRGEPHGPGRLRVCLGVHVVQAWQPTLAVNRHVITPRGRATATGATVGQRGRSSRRHTLLCITSAIFVRRSISNWLAAAGGHSSASRGRVVPHHVRGAGVREAAGGWRRLWQLGPVLSRGGTRRALRGAPPHRGGHGGWRRRHGRQPRRRRWGQRGGQGTKFARCLLRQQRGVRARSRQPELVARRRTSTDRRRS